MTSPTLILPERSLTCIASDLRAAIGVDKVKDDYSTLTAYAVDASIYRITPQAIVLVESEVRPWSRHGALCRTAGHPR